MRFGSVCSGIEAASVAWEPLGWQASWLAEVDVAASAVLAHRLGATAPVYPAHGKEKAIKRIAWGDRLTNWGDMTKLPDLVRSGAAEAPDILCGGTPCQGFSLSGLRKGLADPRGQLTLSFVEIGNAIDDRRAVLGQQPCAIFWENVPGVRSDKGNAFGHFLAALVGLSDPVEPGPRPEPGRSSAHWSWEKKTGEHVPRWSSAGVVAGPRRTVGWRSFDAQYFGLAQRRERLFLVGSACDGFDPQVVLFEFDGLRRDSAPSRGEGQDVARTLAARTDGDGFPGTDEACSGYVQPVGCESPAGVTYQDVSHCLNAGGMGRIDYETESFVLQPVFAIQERAASENLNAGPQSKGYQPDVAHTLEARQQTQSVALSVALRGREGGGAAELGDEIATTLRASGGGGDKHHVLAFSSKDYGADATYDLAPTMRAMGHHESHANAGGQLAVCVTGSSTHALKADGFDGSEDGTGRGQPIVTAFNHNAQSAQLPKPYSDCSVTPPLTCSQGAAAAVDMAVRRLMPVECERLQGFPDNHTLVPVGKGMAADGPRYKQLGNSWAVPCVTWIGKRLAAHLGDIDCPRSSTDISELFE